MADNAPPAPAPPPRPDAVPGPLAALAASASPADLQRAHRIVSGTDGAFWERHLVTGELWYSNNFFVRTGLEPTCDRLAVHAHMHPEDRPAFEAAYAEAVACIGPLNLTLRYRSASDEWRWARLQGRVWPDGEGRAERIVGQVIDVHEETLAREDLLRHRQGLQQMVDERTASLVAALDEARRQREQAEQANEAKSLFLAHMSHEIRTPLNGLLGLNELALREARNEQQRRFLRLALQSGRALLDILNGVLDFSRLNAGASAPRAEAFDLADTLANAVRQVMPLARTKNLGVMFDMDGEISRVVGDPQRIQQIAANLLTNAVKYTERGHIALSITIRPTVDDQAEATLAFSDTGTGMTEAVAARVFEPFVQGDDSLARRHGGTGLGLSIAQGLAQSMGGSLTLHSVPGEGSCFTVRLPLRIQDGLQPAARPVAPGHAWLVYNRNIPAQWFAARLARLGWRSSHLGSVAQAIASLGATGYAAAPTPPDLVVLAEAVLDTKADLKALRASLPDTRIVLLVRPDWNQPKIEAAARMLDMPLVFMPLTPHALIDLLSLRVPLADTSGTGFGDLDGGVGDVADVLIAEDNPVNQLIITEMVASLGLRPRLVENGAQAITACQDSPPRLVLMDLQMPEIDGLEATRRLCSLQRQGALQAFPIVALTAHATPQDRDRCFDAGMQGFLTKPISLGLLRSELRRWITL